MMKKILLLAVTGLILLVSFRISQSRSLSLRFVDEDDHLAGADLINRGYRLHEQIQSNHQPLVYFASSAITKFTRSDNLFMLVRRHRQAVWFYGAWWSLLLVLRFSWPGLILVLFFEWLKYGLLGNLLLMESLAVYPAVYLLFVWLFVNRPRPVELLFLGFCSFLIIFNLVPLYPWLAVIWLAYLVKFKNKVIYPIISFLFFSFILFFWYSPAAWWRETIYNNWLYAVPALNQVKNAGDWLKIIFFPFTAYFTPGSLQAQFISLFFTGFLFATWFNRKLLWLYPLLLLANNRVLSPAAAYYEGFHLLPWLGLLIVVFSYSLKFLPKYLLAGLGLWSLVLLLNRGMPYFNRTDPNYEYYVNYSTAEDVNFAIKNIATTNDRLAVTAFQPLVSWQTNTQLATRQLVYYAWQSGMPELKAEYERVFYGANPPEIIYGSNDPQLLAAKYVNVLKFGGPTELYLRRDKFDSITDSQWAALETRGFSPSSASD